MTGSSEWLIGHFALSILLIIEKCLRSMRGAAVPASDRATINVFA